MMTNDGATTGENAQEEPKHILDSATPWLLAALAALAACGAVLRVTGIGDRPNRLDEITLLYLAVAASLLLLRKVKTLSFGSYKLEMLEQIRERQVRQEDLLRSITSRFLPLLLPKPELNHLLNLSRGATANYGGGSIVQAELRRLRSVGLLRTKVHPDGHSVSISQLASGKFDLSAVVELTPLGEEWVTTIRDMETARGAGAAAVAQGAQATEEQ